MTPRTEAGKFLQAGLEALGFAADDAAERIVAIEIEAADCVLHDHTGPCIPEGPALRPSVEPAGDVEATLNVPRLLRAMYAALPYSNWTFTPEAHASSLAREYDRLTRARLLPTQASDSRTGEGVTWHRCRCSENCGQPQPGPGFPTQASDSPEKNVSENPEMAALRATVRQHGGHDLFVNARDMTLRCSADGGVLWWLGECDRPPIGYWCCADDWNAGSFRAGDCIGRTQGPDPQWARLVGAEVVHAIKRDGWNRCIVDDEPWPCAFARQASDSPEKP